MQRKMIELQDHIQEQQFEITALNEQNEYLKEFKPDLVGQKTNECSVCNMLLTTGEFYSHMCEQQLDVDNSDVIRCEYCPKSYDSMIKLLNHLHVSHSQHIDKQFYHCKQCPKIFVMAKLMDIHEKTHPEEKPEIACDKCPHIFLTQQHYDEHVRKEHPDPEESSTMKRKQYCNCRFF